MNEITIGRIREMIWEAAAVLAAILVAFALDAWWDARVERESMLDALEAVATELRGNVAALDTAVALNTRTTEMTREMMSVSEADVLALSDQEIERLIQFPEYEILTFERGAITAFVEGGFLQAVDDDHLRTAIARISTVQEELDEEAGGVQLAADRWGQRGIEEMPIEILRDAGTGLDGQRRWLAWQAGDEGMYRVLSARAFSLALYTGEMERLRDGLVESLMLIEGRLE